MIYVGLEVLIYIVCKVQLQCLEIKVLLDPDSFDQENYMLMYNTIICQCTILLYVNVQYYYMSMYNTIICQCTKLLYINVQYYYM